MTRDRAVGALFATFVAIAVGAGIVACAAPPRWHDDVAASLSRARAEGRDLVVYFALRGREASDRMERELGHALVREALADGAFAACIADGGRHKNLYGEWIGGSEGMGIAVLDGRGRCYATRPGPQDPPELAAFLRACAAARLQLAALRAAMAQPSAAPLDSHALGCALLELGCRKESEALLLDAAVAGVADARHRLARLYALDGNVSAARRWLANAPATPAALATEGYVLFKERRHREAIAAFERALADPRLGDERQRALLYLGKSLHEDKQDARAVPLLLALAAEGTGSTFEASALHTLSHIQNPQHGHSH